MSLIEQPQDKQNKVLKLVATLGNKPVREEETVMLYTGGTVPKRVPKSSLGESETEYDEFGRELFK